MDGECVVTGRRIILPGSRVSQDLPGIRWQADGAKGPGPGVDAHTPSHKQPGGRLLRAVNGLKTYYVLFFIRLKTRAVAITGNRSSPKEAFMAQVARNLTVPVEGFPSTTRLLICDRDTEYTCAFKKTLKNAEIKTVLTPYRAPNCNAYAERFAPSIKSECLNNRIGAARIFG